MEQNQTNDAENLDTGVENPEQKQEDNPTSNEGTHPQKDEGNNSKKNKKSLSNNDAKSIREASEEKERRRISNLLGTDDFESVKKLVDSIPDLVQKVEELNTTVANSEKEKQTKLERNFYRDLGVRDEDIDFVRQAGANLSEEQRIQLAEKFKPITTASTKIQYDPEAESDFDAMNYFNEITGLDKE